MPIENRNIRGSGSRCGFTLVELIVVMAIVSLLIAMLMPSLQKARTVAQQIDCGNRHRQMMVGLLTYIEASDDYFSPWVGPNVAGAFDRNWPVWYRLDQLGYLSSRDSGVGGGFYLCPSGPRFEPAASGYLAFGDVSIGYSRYLNYPDQPNFRPARLGRLPHPTRTAVWADSTDHLDPTGQSGTNAWHRRDQLAYRHNETATVAYVDGHVESGRVRYEDLPSHTPQGPWKASPFFFPYPQ